MIRFLQTEGPVKKIILSGLLLLICAAMVIAFVPGGLGNELTGTPGKGVVAKVSGEDITVEQVKETARQMAQQQAQQYGANASMLMPFLIQQDTQRAADQLPKGNVCKLDLDIGVSGFKLLLHCGQGIELALYDEVVDDFNGHLSLHIGQGETRYRGA